MVRQFGFFVNSDACSGCRTCQVACKDRHDTRAGVHWRRVYEVTAGGWQQKDAAWVPAVAAYHLSVSCFHCQTPVCGQQCSTEAIWKRADGIVFIDESKCTKCHKCENDCPYGAIRWDADARRRPQVRLLRGGPRRRPAARLCGGVPEPGARLRGVRRTETAIRQREPCLSAGRSRPLPAPRSSSSPTATPRPPPRALRKSPTGKRSEKKKGGGARCAAARVG